MFSFFFLYNSKFYYVIRLRTALRNLSCCLLPLCLAEGRFLPRSISAKGHLFERQDDFSVLRELIESGFNIIDEPIHFRIAVATHRFVAGNGEMVELYEHRVLPLDFEA